MPSVNYFKIHEDTYKSANKLFECKLNLRESVGRLDLNQSKLL